MKEHIFRNNTHCARQLWMNQKLLRFVVSGNKSLLFPNGKKKPHTKNQNTHKSCKHPSFHVNSADCIFNEFKTTSCVLRPHSPISFSFSPVKLTMSISCLLRKQSNPNLIFILTETHSICFFIQTLSSNISFYPIPIFLVSHSPQAQEQVALLNGEMKERFQYPSHCKITWKHNRIALSFKKR